MLAAGTGAQAGFSTITFAVAVMAPDLRDLYDLSLTEIGVVLAAEWIGLTVAMLPWGFAADRYGERATLAVGLVACSGFLAAAAFAPDYRIARRCCSRSRAWRAAASSRGVGAR